MFIKVKENVENHYWKKNITVCVKLQPEVDLGVEKQFPISNYGWIERKKNESVEETQCPDVDLYNWVETNIRQVIKHHHN